MAQALKGARTPSSVPDYAASALAIIAFAAASAGILAPETANDSLCYHLNLPKIYLQEGRISTVPFDYNSEFPLLMEMLYTFALGLGSETLAKFFHFASGLLMAVLAGWTVHRLTESRRAGVWVALLLLTAPVVFNELTTTYVDVGLACFTFFAWICLIIWSEDPAKNGKLVLLAGLFSGFAMSVKYLALISIISQLLFLTAASLRKQPDRLIKNLTVFSAAAFLSGGYWYIRAFLVTGNPVFPYFAQIFQSGNPAIHYDDIGVKKTFGSLLRVFWTLTMKPQLFEGYGVQIGPGFLAFLPAGILWLKRKPVISWFYAYALIYLLAWFMLGQSLRFLVPVLPVLAVIAGTGLAGAGSGWAARGLGTLFALVIAFQTALGIYHARRDFKFALGKESREQYLMRHERSFRTARYVNQNLPADALILNADETHMFHFKRKMVRETSLAGMSPEPDKYWKKAVDPQGVIEALKTFGFTHILFAFREGAAPEPESEVPLRVPAFLSKPEDNLASILNPLYTDAFTDEEGITTRYILYKIL